MATRHDMVSIPAYVVLDYIERLMRFPYPTICRHSVAADLLSDLERFGMDVPNELASAVVHADDGMALSELEKIRSVGA